MSETWLVLTSNGMSVVGRLAPGDEDDISLARVCVFVFEEEKIVDAVIAQGRGLDNHAKWTGQLLFNNEVLLSADLGGSAPCTSVTAVPRAQTAGASRPDVSTYSLEEIEQVRLRLASDLLRVKPRTRSHGDELSMWRVVC